MDCTLYRQTAFRRAAGAAFRPGGLRLTRALAEACDLRPGQRALDAGCGVGSTCSFLAREYALDVVGLDGSAEFIEEARARDDRVTWILGTAASLPFGDDSFHVVFCECFLSQLDSAIAVLDEIRRVLRPDGRLAMSDVYLRNPDPSVAPGALPAGTCLHGALTSDRVVTMLDSAGFELEMWEDRSEALKVLMASLIFAYGSAKDFWGSISGGGIDIQDWISQVRPGYYTLVARPR